jgi:hypothetical protein
MKKVLTLVGVTVMVLGLTFSAQASQIINDGTEPNLSEILSDWGYTVTLTQLQNATVLENLPAGSYTFTKWASHSAWQQVFGYDNSNELKDTGGATQGQGVASTVFSSASDIFFYDTVNGGAATRTTVNQHSGQSSGFIFDMSQFTACPPYTCYVVAFEDQLYGDSDYNDFVAQVCPTPIPGGLLLLGSGLIGVLGLRRKMVA